MVAGKGLTVMATLLVEPEQLFAVGVTIYVAVPADVPELDNVCAIVAPLLLLPPVIPASWLTVQAKVVPATLELKVILVVAPLHMI